jgi:hypothetical protein
MNPKNTILVFVDVEIWQGRLVMTEAERHHDDKEGKEFPSEAMTCHIRM